MKKFKGKWLLCAAVLSAVLSGAVAFAAADLFSGGTKEYSRTNAADGDRIFGGALDAKVKSGTKVTVSGSLAPSMIFGGGFSSGAGALDSSVIGGTEIVFNSSAQIKESAGGSFSAIFGGGTEEADNAVSDVNGDTRITFNKGGVYGYGSSCRALIAGGGRPVSGSSVKVTGSTYIELNDCVIQAVTVSNDSGKEIEGFIFGGGAGGDSYYGAYDFTIGGSTNITVNGGPSAKMVNMSIYGGACLFDGLSADGRVKGGSNINIVGANGLKMIGQVLTLSGGGRNWFQDAGGFVHNSGLVGVLGTKTLLFDGCGPGTVGASIKEFDVIRLKGANALTFVQPLSRDVTKVKVEGTFAEDTLVLTLADGSFVPALDGTNAKWNGNKLVALKNSESPDTGAAKPVKPVFDAGVTSVDALLPEVKTDAAATAALFPAGAGIKSSDLDADSSGHVLLRKSLVIAAGGEYSEAYPLPVFTAAATETAKGAAIACAFEVKGASLLAETPEKVKLLKYKGKLGSQLFTYSDQPADFAKDGCFTIQTSDDRIAAKGGKIAASDKYKIVLFIKDNGSFDLDASKGAILDPALIVKAAPEKHEDSGSSGGCSAGFAAFALLTLLPLVRRRG